jgi:chromosome segregation ATPase
LTQRAWTICLALLLPAGVTAVGQAQEASTEAKALIQKIEDLKRATREPLREQIEHRREALAKEADTNALRADLEGAQKAMDARSATAPAIVEARKAEAAAAKAVPEAVRARLGAHPKLQTVTKELDELKTSRPQLEADQQDAHRQLAAIRGEVESSPELEKYRQALEDADQAFRSLPEMDPRMVAARKASEDARRALEEKIKSLPEKKAFDEAAKAYDDLLRNSPELAQARQARQDARAAMQQRLEQLLRADPRGAEAVRRVEQLEQRQAEAEAQLNALEEEAYAVRREIERNDPAVLLAREAREQAQAKVAQALADHAPDEQKALESAKAALQKKLADKATEDLVMQELQARLAKAQKEIDALHEQLQQTPPKPSPTAAEAGGEEE